MRYRLLETVRQYGEQKLTESGEAPRVKRQHAAYYAGLAEEWEPRIDTRERRAVLARLDVEHDNLRVALRLAAETGDTAQELRLCHALLFFWFHGGYWSEGRGWLRDALERSSLEGPTKARGRALAHDGMLACFMGDIPAAMRGLEEAAAIHRAVGDPRDLGHALRFLVFAIAGERRQPGPRPGP